MPQRANSVLTVADICRLKEQAAAADLSRGKDFAVVFPGGGMSARWISKEEAERDYPDELRDFCS